MSQRQILAKCFDAVLLVIVGIWLAMFLPVAVYFLPETSIYESQPENITSFTQSMVPCQNLQNVNDSTELPCREDFKFFPEPATGGFCKPKCSSWLMYSQPAEVISLAIIGISTVVGIITTIVIIILSFVHFTSMLEFPSVLILYQDIIMSIHGVMVLIGFMDRRLFCNSSDDLIESYDSSSTFCTISGIVSSFIVYPLTVWIAIQVSYTTLAVRAPFYFKKLKKKKRREHILHAVSVLVGFLSLVVPSMLTLGLGGFSSIDTRFPPIICWAKNRYSTVFTFLIPMGVMLSIINTELVLILHFLMRNRCISKSSNKELKKAEIKVLIMCCWYVVLGLGTMLAYSLSSAILGDLQHELIDYFECERCGVNSGQVCDRSGFEQFTNPLMVTIGYSLLDSYPLITLIYVLRIKRKPQTKQALPDITSSL